MYHPVMAKQCRLAQGPVIHIDRDLIAKCAGYPRWSSNHFLKVEMVLTYPSLVRRDGCDGVRSSRGSAA